MPIFLVLIVMVIAIICTPYILLFWWLKPISMMGYLGVFALASTILFTLVAIIGMVHHHLSNRA